MTGITFLAGFEWVKTVNQLRERQRGIRCKCSRTQLVHLSSRPPVRLDPISISRARAPFFRSVFLRLITPIHLHNCAFESCSSSLVNFCLNFVFRQDFISRVFRFGVSSS
jgi:hypothetical protein